MRLSSTLVSSWASARDSIAGTFIRLCRVQILQALQWEAAPVVTDFDVRFNSKRLLWFEKLFQPFLSGTYKTEEEPLYDK